jgi:hypothetical protein
MAEEHVDLLPFRSEPLGKRCHRGAYASGLAQAEQFACDKRDAAGLAEKAGTTELAGP